MAITTTRIMDLDSCQAFSQEFELDATQRATLVMAGEFYAGMNIQIKTSDNKWVPFAIWQADTNNRAFVIDAPGRFRLERPAQKRKAAVELIR